jgi:hypothetical protein
VRDAESPASVVAYSCDDGFIAKESSHDDERPSVIAVPGAAPPQMAVIEQSASTNRAGYTITISRTGSAEVRIGASVRTTSVAAATVQALFADLDRAGALGELPVGHCMKSASFGTTTHLVYDGQRSPDLQCPQTADERALGADVRAIADIVLAPVPAQSGP